MSLSNMIAEARSRNDWSMLAHAIPCARLLSLRIDTEGGEFKCTMPIDRTLSCNPMVPALHVGATSGLLECAGILYVLLNTDGTNMPQTIDFNINYLCAGQLQDTYASVVMFRREQKVANVRVQAWQSHPDKPIALGQGNFMLRT